uniref:Tetratricopeptide SHNi-TPR domain-containing protein n=1 Tax=Bracon brevicornis TaxID=1563983 RepID=A0A6V7KTX7_9HYME
MADAAEQTTEFTDPAAAISQGKRHLLVRDYTAAVDAFTKALQLLSRKHDHYDDEVGEPYLLYGRALLGLSREQNSVLGDGVPGGDDSEEDDDDDDDEDADEDKLSNGENDDEQGNEEKSDDKDTSETDAKKSDEKSVKGEEEQEAAAGKSDEAKVNNEKQQEPESLPGTSKDHPKENGECSKAQNGHQENGEAEDDNTNDVEEGEDVHNVTIDLQVAWEVLELAKIVFQKRGASGYKQLAETHRLLGEVAMESSNHQIAVSDLEKALKILENVEPFDPRAIAEIHYHLGLAHSLGNDFDASIQHFHEATNLLQARIKELEETEETPQSDDPFYSVEGEIKELKELLPEIQEKITDMQDFREEQCRLVIEQIKIKAASSCSNGGAGPSSDAGASSSDTAQPTKPASDISHLVRKKRKNEDTEITETASPAKKPTP